MPPDQDYPPIAARSAADIILTAPGLGVINEAVKQARITFERMKSYSIFRIAETIRIILFMTLSIVVFSFYPITALMIILLALLNDIPILAIAYDNTRVDIKPVRWNLPEMLTISSVLGIAGVIASFLLFFLLRENGFPDDMIQSMLFLKLIVAGHSTVYITRTPGWFWQRPWPAPLLLGATFRYRDHRHPDRRVRLPDQPHWLGTRPLDVGLCAGLVPGQ